MPSSASRRNTLHLPTDQAKKALFPPSCLVSYNPNLHSAHKKDESILSRVTSICIELEQSSVGVTNRLYNLTVDNEQDTIPFVPEHAIFFAPGCPVYCSTRESFQGTCEDDWMEGIVLESKDGKYLVLFHGREWYFPRIRVKYRSLTRIPINLILPSEQAEKAIFPPSCPVRCTDRHAQVNPIITYYVKCVKEISFNNFYDLSVLYKTKMFKLQDISQDNLRFAPDCPVYISKSENFQDILEEDYLEGNVLKLNDNGEYLVSFCGIECSFPQSRLKYRPGTNAVSEQIDQIGILSNHEVGNGDQTKDDVDNQRIKENDAVPIIGNEYTYCHASAVEGSVMIPKETPPNAEEVSGGDEEAKEHSGKRKSQYVGDTSKENDCSPVSTDSFISPDSSWDETSRKKPKRKSQGAMYNNPRWMELFNALKQFKAHEGHLNVPFKSPQNIKLGRWVNNQRSAYKNSKLGKGRVDLLSGIGFSWSPQKRTTQQNERDNEKWIRKFEALKKFKAEEDHLNVSFVDNPQMAHWISSQKSLYKTGNILEVRVKALEEIGLTDKYGEKIRVSLMRLKNMSKISPPK